MFETPDPLVALDSVMSFTLVLNKTLRPLMYEYLNCAVSLLNHVHGTQLSPVPLMCLLEYLCILGTGVLGGLIYSLSLCPILKLPHDTALEGSKPGK